MKIHTLERTAVVHGAQSGAAEVGFGDDEWT